MKQFEILDGKALVVELQEGVSKVDYVYKNKMTHLIEEDGESSFLSINGEWHVIGRLSELTEDQAASMVASYGVAGFHNYKISPQFAGCLIKSAKESLESAIQAEGWYFENPYGEEEPTIDDPDPHSQYFGSQMDLVVEWNHKQSRVLDHSRCLLLGRED